MPPHEFSAAEIELVARKYRGLQLVSSDTWEGTLDIDAIFNGEQITDTFRIRIIASAGYPDIVPKLLEIGGRTQEIQKKYALSDVRDLHHNPNDGTACVCVRQEEQFRFPPGSTLDTYIQNLAVPYLYGLGYFDIHGRWPWPEFSHGLLGLLEYHAEDVTEPTAKKIEALADDIVRDSMWKEFSKHIRKPSPDRCCLCGSKRPFQRCHPEAWRGLRKLHADIEMLGINARGLFQPKPKNVPLA